MISLKTSPAYSLVFTAVSEEAVDIRPPILFHCFVCKQSCLSDSDALHKHTFCWWGHSSTAPCNLLGLLLLLSTSKSSAVTAIRLNEINAYILAKEYWLEHIRTWLCSLSSYCVMFTMLAQYGFGDPEVENYFHLIGITSNLWQIYRSESVLNS